MVENRIPYFILVVLKNNRSLGHIVDVFSGGDELQIEEAALSLQKMAEDKLKVDFGKSGGMCHKKVLSHSSSHIYFISI